ncbi:cell division topological specificity factor MinE [Deltaproteobacteria bacterium TL4]
MLNRLGRLFRSKPSSANVAKNRLKLVLAKERVGLSESQILQMKQELSFVISKYFEIDRDSLEVIIETIDGQPALNVKTPVSSPL